MSLYDQAYAIVEDHVRHHEGAILLKLGEKWPVEYALAIETHRKEGDDIDDDFIPNLSFVCEQIDKSNEEKFLASLKEIVLRLYDN